LFIIIIITKEYDYGGVMSRGLQGHLTNEIVRRESQRDMMVYDHLFDMLRVRLSRVIKIILTYLLTYLLTTVRRPMIVSVEPAI